MKEKATITVLNKKNKFMSFTTSKTADCLIKRDKALKIDDNTIKLIFYKKDWLKLKKKVIEKEHQICYICGRHLVEGKDKITVDHLIPRSRFGKDCENNLHCCCSICNEDKGNMTVGEYYEHIKNNKEKYPNIDLKRLKKFI